MSAVEKPVPQWVTSWPEWFGIDGNVTVVPKSDYDAANAENERLRQWQKEMVEIQASGGRLDGYRELGAKCATLETEIERLRTELATRHNASLEKAETELCPRCHDNPAVICCALCGGVGKVSKIVVQQYAASTKTVGSAKALRALKREGGGT